MTGLPSRSTGRSATPSRRAALGADLAAFGRELAREGVVQVGGSFTDIEAADRLVKSDSNAFLFGLLFTQGIAAERAWAGPYLLRERLGHLDPRRLAVETEAVASAVAASPALHRFVVNVPRWISGTAEVLVADYGGDASRIWPAGDAVTVVIERLMSLPGIGRKKAVMGAEMLVRHFGIGLDGMSCGSVAYDVHVRRVFLRSGLVDEDTPRSVEAAAAAACPDEPGLLDLPAWLVGRRWCRPRTPECDDCRLGRSCLRRTDLRVEGVGVRR